MEQLAVPPVPTGLHVGALKVPEDDGLSLKVTVALGVILGPLLVSETVAVHVVTAFARTSVEVQTRFVEVVL